MEALQRLSRGLVIDLMITDLILPDMAGCELAAAFIPRSRARDCCICLCIPTR
jgi:CheY-like chemotaxis protein